MPNIISPHDKLFKVTMSRPEVAKDFLQEHLPAHIKQLVNLNTLQQCPPSFIDEKMRKHEADILYSVDFDFGCGYIYLLFEHLSNPDALIAFRMLKYMTRIMQQHLDETKTKILCPIYPIIVYTGKNKYPYSTSLSDLFGGSKKIVEDIFLRPFQLIDVKDIPDKSLQDRIIFGLMVKAAIVRAKKAAELVRELLPYLQGVEKADIEYFKFVIEYLLHTKDVDDRDRLIQELTTHLSSDAGEKVMTTVAQYLRQEGRQEGSMQTAERIAAALLSEHEKIDRISRLTGLPEKQIRALKQKEQ